MRRYTIVTLLCETHYIIICVPYLACPHHPTFILRMSYPTVPTPYIILYVPYPAVPTLHYCEFVLLYSTRTLYYCAYALPCCAKHIIRAPYLACTHHPKLICVCLTLLF